VTWQEDFPESEWAPVGEPERIERDDHRSLGGSEDPDSESDRSLNGEKPGLDNPHAFVRGFLIGILSTFAICTVIVVGIYYLTKG
jgi:hypothetical protein